MKVRTALDDTDREAFRYRVFCADRMLERLAPRPGERILDIAAGTGLVALGAAQIVNPAGRVIAINDASAGSGRLLDKLAQFGIANIDVHEMSSEHLDFRRDYFDKAACLFGLSATHDPQVALREWRRVLRPGGQLVCAVLAEDALQPYAGELQGVLKDRGVTVQVPWQQSAKEHDLRAQMSAAGFATVEISRVPIAYHLPGVDDWWEIVRHGELQSWVRNLTGPVLEAVRTVHLRVVASHIGENGLWLDVPVLLASGWK